MLHHIVMYFYYTITLRLRNLFLGSTFRTLKIEEMTTACNYRLFPDI